MSTAWKKGNKKTNVSGLKLIISEIRLLFGVSCATSSLFSRPDQPAQRRGKKTKNPNKPEKSKKTHWNLEYNL